MKMAVSVGVGWWVRFGGALRPNRVFLSTYSLLVLYILNRMVEQKTNALRPNLSEPAQN